MALWAAMAGHQSGPIFDLERLRHLRKKNHRLWLERSVAEAVQVQKLSLDGSPFDERAPS